MAEAQIKITADSTQAQRDIKKLDAALDDLKDRAALAAVALGTITAAAAALGVAIVKTLGAAGDLVDASNRLGVSAENLQRLQQAAQLAGVGADQLNASIQRLSISIGEGLNKGSGPAVDALTRLGIPIREIAAQRPDQQFERISQALIAIENPAQRAAAAVDLFGKQGPAILGVVNELEKVQQITRDIGFGVTERDLVALDEAGDRLDQLSIIWDAGIKKVVAEIAPLIVGFVERIKEAIKQAGGFEGVWQRVKAVLHSIVNIMLIMATIITARLVVGAGMFAAQMIRVHGVVKAITTLLARTPIGLLAAGAAIVADKLGVDLVGGLTEALGLQDDFKLGTDQINTALDQRTEELNRQAEVQQQITEEQKKALAAVEKQIQGYERARDAAVTRLTTGDTESQVQQRISDITEKLKEQNLELTAAMRDRVTIATQEEELAKRLFDRRKQIEDLQQQAAIRGGANSELIKLQKDIEKATADRMQAEIGMNNQLLGVAIQQESTLKQLYKDRVIEIARAVGEQGKIQSEYYDQVNRLEYLKQELIRAGIGEETQLYQQLTDEKLRLQEEYNRKLEDLELKRIEKVLMAERSGIAQQLSAQDRALLQRKGADERQQAIVRERIEFEKKSEFEKAQWAIQQGATVFNALGAQNKRAFEAAKAFNIAQALMNTYAGATKALATYPWPFGLIAAAAAVAAGLAQVAQIRAQTYSGRALGGPVMNNTPYIVGESGPELFVPNTTGSIVRNGDLGGSTVNVNFSIVANDTTGFDQLLFSRRGMITQIINDAVLERGKRSIA